MRSQINSLLVALLAASTLVSCGGSVVEVRGEFITATDSMVYIESFSTLSRGAIIDSASLNSKGEFTLRFKSDEDELSLYNLVYDHYRIPLLLEGGDRVKVKSMGDIVNNYRVEGSAESEQLRNFYQPYVSDITELNRIATKYADPAASEQSREELASRYTKLYHAIRRKQVEYIVENKSSLAAVYAISQRLAGDTYIFNPQSDVIYYRTLLEAIEQSYPESKYLKVLQNRVSELDMINRISEDIATISLPEIDLKDMYGATHKLSESLAELTLLSFWSPELGNSNMFNAELKEVYEKYNLLGFQVYQVAIDPMRSRWIKAVQEQELPWICVNDQSGGQSAYLKLYNVTTLPLNYLIDNQGDIIAQNISIDELDIIVEQMCNSQN